MSLHSFPRVGVGVGARPWTLHGEARAFTVWMRPETHELLAGLALRHGTTKSQVVREALREYALHEPII